MYMYIHYQQGEVMMYMYMYKENLMSVCTCDLQSSWPYYLTSTSVGSVFLQQQMGNSVVNSDVILVNLHSYATEMNEMGSIWQIHPNGIQGQGQLTVEHSIAKARTA